jgi:hypothetical protein
MEITMPTTTAEKVRKPTVTDRLDEQITELSRRCRMDNWAEFIGDFELPEDLLPAVMSGRYELVRAATPRAMTGEEVAKLYRLIGVLLETNAALREHAQQVAEQVGIWTDAFKHLNSVGNRIEHFANFRRTLGPEDETQEDEAVSGRPMRSGDRL